MRPFSSRIDLAATITVLGTAAVSRAYQLRDQYFEQL
jgi:hypothetical protein